MPIDSIEYFGLTDTKNPFTTTEVSKRIVNIYEIISYSNAGCGIIQTGLIPDVDSFQTAIIEVIDPISGNVISVLSPVSVSNSNVHPLPALGECILFFQDQFKSSLFVNNSYIGKYLKIDIYCVSCSVMGEWMNIVPGNFMQLIPVAQNSQSPKGSWIKCSGLEVNRFLYPKYNTIMNTLNYPYGKIGNNPKTPDLRYHVLMGSGGGKLNQANIGIIQNKFLQPDMEKAHYTHDHTLTAMQTNESVYTTGSGTGTGRNVNITTSSSRSMPAGAWGRGGQFGQTVSGTSPITDYYMASGITINDFIYSNISAPPHYGIDYYIKVV